MSWIPVTFSENIFLRINACRDTNENMFSQLRNTEIKTNESE